MTDPTDLLNAGEVVEALGAAWTFAHVGPGVRASFGARLKADARQELFDARKSGDLPEDLFRESLASLQEEIAAGAYAWGSPLDPDGMGSAVRAALQQTRGKVRLLQLLLKPHHGEVPPERVLALIADNPGAVAEAVRACMGQSPNPRPPATKGVPGEPTPSPTATVSRSSPRPASAGVTA